MKERIAKLPGIKRLARWRAAATLHRRVPLLHPPGHFYSVLPSHEQLARDRDRIFGPQVVRGIDLESAGALELRRAFPPLASSFPFGAEPRGELRYGAANGFFSEADALVLFCFLLHLRPKRWIEIGCGHSTRLVLDSSRDFLDDSVSCTIVDPYADRLLGWMSEHERSQHRVLNRPVQDVSMQLFTELVAGDVLFIDSSHAAKAGSDVNWLLFEVLPRLAEGVIVHIHDIPWPFEYPESWYRRGFVWNEAYLVRALLQESQAFEVLWFNGYMAEHHDEYLRAEMPLCLEDGVSLWLRRSAQPD